MKVKISGPGGVIDYEASVVFNALVSAGVSVQIVDSPYVKFLQPKELAEWKKTLEERKVKKSVVLTVDAQPWGG